MVDQRVMLSTLILVTLLALSAYAQSGGGQSAYGQSAYAQGMKMSTSGNSVDVVLDIKYGTAHKDAMGYVSEPVDYTITFYKPGTSEIMPNVYYALVDYSNDAKAECPSTNNDCRNRIPGMFGGSNIGIQVVDNRQTLDTISSGYHGLQQGIYVEKTPTGGQYFQGASVLQPGSNSIVVIVGAINGKQIPQETAKFNINVTPEFPVQMMLPVITAVLVGTIIMLSRTSRISLKGQ